MIKCSLDEDDCIDLMTVLRVVNQIDQEQAWALCYGLGDLMQRLHPPSSNCALIESLAQIQLHKDGYVHEKSCSISHQRATQPETTTTTTTTTATANVSPPPPPPPPPPKLNHLDTSMTQLQQTTPTSTPPITPEPANHQEHLMRSQRRAASSEQELVASLCTALFWALDYNIPDDKERKLNRAMEYLIVQSQSQLQLRELLDVCINRLTHLPAPTKLQADQHYRNILSTLIDDTIQLSILLEKIYTASMVLSDITLDDCLEHHHHHHHLHHHHPHKSTCDILRQVEDDDPASLSEFGEPLASLRALRINDWARLWMQVIRELRQMGKFKQALLVN